MHELQSPCISNLKNIHAMTTRLSHIVGVRC